MDERKLQRKWRMQMDILNGDKTFVYQQTFIDRQKIKQFKKYVLDQPYMFNDKVLVIGQGLDVLLSLDTQYLIRGTLIDQSPRYLRKPMHMYPHFSYQQLLKEYIPFKDNKFDQVICIVPIDRFNHKEAMIAEMQRVVKDESKLYINGLK